MTRFVSVGNARKLKFGGSWVCTAFMMLVAFLFLRQTECGIPLYDRQTTATVTRVEETRSEENEQRIYRIDYTFRDDRGTTRAGTSYDTTKLAGEQPVLYLGHDPDASRLVEARTKPFGTTGFVVSSIIYLVAIGMALKRYGDGVRWVHLLRHGTEVTGVETDRVHIPGDSDTAEKWRITFAYVRDGRPLTYEYTTTNEQFPSQVRVLYEGAFVSTIEEIPVDLTKEPRYSAYLCLLPCITIGLAIATVVSGMVH